MFDYGFTEVTLFGNVSLNGKFSARVKRGHGKHKVDGIMKTVEG